MEESKNMLTNESKYADEPFVCPNCGPFVRVVVENWMLGVDEPSHFDFVHHINYEPQLAYKLQIQKPSDGQMVSIAHCAECNTGISVSPVRHLEWSDSFVNFPEKNEK